MRMQRHRRLSLTLCFCFLLPPALMSAAGQNTAELRGAVSDQAGAFIAGASVELRGTRIYTTRTDAQGQYLFPSIVPGRYKLKVIAEGFAAFAKDVEINSRPAAPLDVTLRILLDEKIEVRGGADDSSTGPENQLFGLTLSEEELRALPNDPDQLLLILQMMAGGAGEGGATVYVDGLPPEGRIPPKSAIQSIRINSNPFSAEFSEPGRSRIEIVTKPGSDRFHGEATFYFNDSVLNARNAFAPTRAPQQSKNYSGYLSGPLVANRWDFFVYGGLWQQDESSIVNAVVLDDAALLPQPFTTTVVTPTSNRDLSLHSSLVLTKKHTLGFGYNLWSGGTENQGLQGGFDLPERAFNSSSRNDAFRLSVTSVPGERLLNQLRVHLRRYRYEAQSLNSGAATLVLAAFNAGGNQGALFSQMRNKGVQVSDNLSYTRKRHTIKLGAWADAVYLSNFDRSNFSGTFTFGNDVERDAAGKPLPGGDGMPIIITPLERYRRTLLGLPGYHPSQFSITRGDPSVNLSQWEISWFVQDEWRVSNQLMLSYGLRHQSQTNIADRLNLAPRVGVAWAPGKGRKGVVRLGAGLFYKSVAPGITLDTLRLDGKRQREVLIEQPAFFPEIPAILSDSPAHPSTLRTKAEGMHAPYSVISKVGYERQLSAKVQGSIGYTWQRGVHLLRTRNINAPLPGSGTLPFPNLGPVLEFESTGKLTRHELKLTLQTKIDRRLNLFANYSLASARTDTEGAYFAPADPYDLSKEFARSSLDQRHRLAAGASMSLMWDLRFSPFLFASSGRPFNITTGQDNNGDTFFTDRPALVGASSPGAIVTRFGAFDPTPNAGDRINPRNSAQGPGQVNLNASLSKTFSLNLSPPPGNNSRADNLDDGAEIYPLYLTFSLDVENVLNQTNLAGFNGVLGSPFFGRANRALEARRILLGARVNF